MPRVRYAAEGPIGWITIDRPEVLNALDASVLQELGQRLVEVGPEIRCLILTGGGAKAFVAGADIAAMRAMPPMEARRFSELGQQITKMIEELPQPVIAAVNGFALGGGCELALACDFILASDKARFGQPEVKLGIIPGFGGTQRLARVVGAGWARRLIYSGETIDATQALAIGLVAEVVPAEALMGRARELADLIAANGPQGVALAKRAINAGNELDRVRGLQMEADLFGCAFTTADRAEGLAAFLEKRPPKFLGQ